MNNTIIEFSGEQDPEIIREKILRCKMIALDQMKIDPMTNAKTLGERDKKLLIKKIKSLLSLSDMNIKEMFNDLCNDTIFRNGNDIDKYSIYVDPRFKKQQEKINNEEPELEALKKHLQEHNEINSSPLEPKRIFPDGSFELLNKITTKDE